MLFEHSKPNDILDVLVSTEWAQMLDSLVAAMEPEVLLFIVIDNNSAVAATAT